MSQLQAIQQFLPMLMSIPNMMDQQGKDFLAFLSNQGRYDEGKDILKKLRDQMTAAQQQTGEKYASEWGALPGSTYQGLTDIIGAIEPNMKALRAEGIGDWDTMNTFLQDRMDRNMATLEGMGQQERRDIIQRFQSEGEKQKQSLADQGLSGTTIAPSLASGLKREQSSALGDLEERLRGAKIGLDTQLSGDVLKGMEAKHAFSQSSGGGVLDWLSNMYQKRLGDTTSAQQTSLANRYMLDRAPMEKWEQLTFPYVNWIGNREDVYPSEANYLQQMQFAGQSSAPPVQYPSGGSGSEGLLWGLGGAAGAELGAGAALLAMGAKLFTCLDADVEITMNDASHKRLRDVQIGDVLAGGTIVMDKDLGEPWPNRRGDYIKITTTHSSIVLTNDHHIAGMPAGKLRLGDGIPTETGGIGIVTRIEVAEAVCSGDLLLSGGTTYYANGLLVTSMFNVYFGSDRKARQQ